MTRIPLFALLALSACAEVPTYVYGESLGPLEFSLYSRDMGVYPDASVLDDPNNPFRFGIGAETKWEVAEDGPVAAFYGWATALVGEPTGEHQFFAAANAHAIYDQRLAPGEQLVFVRDIAIRGYQNVLDEFPGSVTFSADGRLTFPLGPQALRGIEALGGEVQNGWVLVPTEDGVGAVVREE
jgi:hypothetical protein